MLSQILRSEKPLLLSGHGREQYGAPWPASRRSEGTRNFQQDAASGGIIVGAVEDVVAGHIRTDAEMIVVRGVENGFVGSLAVRAGQDGHYVIRFEVAHLAHHARLQPSAQIHGMEIAGLRGLDRKSVV